MVRVLRAPRGLRFGPSNDQLSGWDSSICAYEPLPTRKKRKGRKNKELEVPPDEHLLEGLSQHLADYVGFVPQALPVPGLTFSK